MDGAAMHMALREHIKKQPGECTLAVEKVDKT